MPRILVLCAGLLLCLAAGVIHAQNLLNGPESVEYDHQYQRYIVSNWMGGNLVVIDSLGLQSIFHTVNDGARNCGGSEIVGDTFYSASAGRVAGYRLDTGALVMDMLIPGTALLNTMVSDTLGYLYVSDAMPGKIYKIDIDNRSYSEFVSAGLITPVGLFYDGENDRLLVTGTADGVNGTIHAVALADSSISLVINTGTPLLDALTRDRWGNYYSTCWDTHALYRFAPDFSGAPEIISSGYTGPAQLCYNPDRDELAVPIFSENRVVIIDLMAAPDIGSADFSDAVFGDNDGCPEAGETIEVVITLINTRFEPIDGVEVRLSCEDASIVMDNETASIGTIAARSSADNAADPLLFTVPSDYNSRIDSFFIAVTYDGSGPADTLIVAQPIGQPRILLVDDDDGDAIEDYYTACLERILVPYDILTKPPVPTTSDLAGYDVVVWFTGDFRLPFDAADITAIRGHLDAGGNLFLTGQGIAAELDLLDADFLNTYLKCEYVNSDFTLVLPVTATSQIFQPGDTAVLIGGAGNQTAPDHLAPVNGGVAELEYMGTGDVAAVSYAGDHRLLFFGFGFEAQPNGSDRWLNRDVAWEQILDFFGFQRPGAAPQVTALTCDAVDAMHAVNHVPEFSWLYDDESGREQAQYHIQVTIDDAWSTAESWDSGPVVSAAASAVYDGLPLQDGQRYYTRVRVHNGVLWSPWCYYQIRMNSVPIISGLSPDGMQEITENPPVLHHPTAVDAESDEMVYSYQLYADEQLTTLIDESLDLTMGGDSAAWSTAVFLDTDADYFWRVRCSDAYEDGEWSQAASFLLVAAYVCGDANGDQAVDVGDAVYIINYVFKGGATPEPVEAGDANSDEAVDVGDAVYVINYVFKGGPAPCD